MLASSPTSSVSIAMFVNSLKYRTPFVLIHSSTIVWAAAIVSSIYYILSCKFTGMSVPADITPEITFKTARSGGKGGQNVNKVETMVEGYLDIPGSSLLTEEQKLVLLQKLR